MTLHVVTWRWWSSRYRETFYPEHVNALWAAVFRNLALPHRFLCITDDDVGVRCETAPIWSDHAEVPNPWNSTMPSCFRRLKLFDPATQAQLGIVPGDRVVSLDLDVIVTGDLTPLFQTDTRFTGWAVKGQSRPRVFNGTVFTFLAGQLSELWTDFDPTRSPRLAHRNGYHGSDQGWLSYKLAETEAGWTEADGLRGYLRDVRATGRLPQGTRLLSFHGRGKPWHPDVQRQLPWLDRYWRMT